MLDSATLFILKDDSSVEEDLAKDIVNSSLEKHSTGLLTLPKNEDDAEIYCLQYLAKFPGIEIKVIHCNGLLDLQHNLQSCMEDKMAVVVAIPVNNSKEVEAYMARHLDNNLVTPSALFLNGQPAQVNRSKCWKLYKSLGKLTRAGADEGMVQWGHLLNELAFCLGFTPKYGD